MSAGAAKLQDASRSAPADLVELGVLRGAYGLQGWSHVQPHSGDAEVLRKARQWWLFPPRLEGLTGPARGPVEVTGVRQQGAALVAKWEGCEDPESAQNLKGWRIAVSRRDFPRLPKGQYYWVDLIGAQVINRAGSVLGTVQGLRNNGAHDLLEVEREGASTPTLIPMVPAYLDAIELPRGRIRVDWEADW
jgi:16S rRNA processing protein RimM